MRNKILCILLCISTILPLSLFSATATADKNRPLESLPGNELFRDEVIRYIQSIAIGHVDPISLQQLDTLDASWNNVYQKTDWSVRITVYHLGQKVGDGYAHGASLSNILKQATARSLMKQQPRGQLSKDELKNYRFKVAFDYYPSRLYAFIEFDDKGLELTGSRVAVRKVDRLRLLQQIKDSQHYLLQTMHPEKHGFFKFYNAAKDQQEDLLRTIYSSSSLYTLIKIHHLTKDAALLTYFKPIANFILSNQAKDGPNAGGFYYGYNPKTQQETCKIVVGTTSKTIFTLLELNKLYPEEPNYLEAAKKAGDWLLTRVNPNGRVSAVASCDSGKWIDSHRQSFLYSGQVLSALSRLYAVTHDARYHRQAARIARRFIAEVKRQGPIVGDDYRPGNSISSSWVLMSLIDFAKVDADPVYRSAINQVAATILSRQIRSKDDVYSNGRYLDAMTTSGNGWINEVMGVLYEFCISNQQSSCLQYQQAMLLSSRWLLQNAYTLENTYNVKNPQRAIGGFITNFTTQTVRTDAVCHGLNSIIMILEGLNTNSNESLVSLPEQPLIELLPLLRAGNGYLNQ